MSGGRLTFAATFALAMSWMSGWPPAGAGGRNERPGGDDCAEDDRVA